MAGSTYDIDDGPAGSVTTITQPVYQVLYIDDTIDVQFVHDGERKRTELRLTPHGRRAIAELLHKAAVDWNRCDL